MMFKSNGLRNITSFLLKKRVLNDINYSDLYCIGVIDSRKFLVSSFYGSVDFLRKDNYVITECRENFKEFLNSGEVLARASGVFKDPFECCQMLIPKVKSDFPEYFI